MSPQGTMLVVVILFVVVVSALEVFFSDPLHRAEWSLWQTFEKPESEQAYRELLRDARGKRKERAALKAERAALGSSVADELRRREINARLADLPEQLDDPDSFASLARAMISDQERREADHQALAERTAREIKHREEMDAVKESVLRKTAFVYSSMFLNGSGSIEGRLLITERRIALVGETPYLIETNGRSQFVSDPSFKVVHAETFADVEECYRLNNASLPESRHIRFITTGLSQLNELELSKLAARGL